MRQRDRVQLGHRLAQHQRGAHQPLAGAGHALAGRLLQRLRQVLAGGEEVLQHVVVQGLGDALAGPVLGVERVGHQLAALRRPGARPPPAPPAAR